MRKFTVLLSILIASISAEAMASDFCEGFESGFKSVKGEFAFPPLCPLKPLTTTGKTDYQLGKQIGARTANAGTTYDAESGNRYRTRVDSQGNTVVNGSNEATGTTWTNKIDLEGNQSGTDAEGRTWRYDVSLATYRRSDGLICRNVGQTNEVCLGGERESSSVETYYSESCDHYGGACYTGYGGAAYAGYGGPCYDGYGGGAYAGYGGPCYDGYGGDMSKCPKICKPTD